MSYAAEFAAYCARYGAPERIELLLSDLNAVLRGKWLPGAQGAKLGEGGARLPMSTYAPNIFGEEVLRSGFGSDHGDPDGYLRPVAGSLAPVPWAGPGVAQVLVEMTGAEGDVLELSPRLHLRRVLERFAAWGWTPVIAPEIEFYFLRPRQEPGDPPLPPPGTPLAQNYDMEALRRNAPVLDEILETCAVQGIAADTMTAEYGPGQFEVNFEHGADALRLADCVVLFRRLVRAVAAKHGLEATFMAKPYAAHPGNGMHVHVSVVDAQGRNVLDGDAGETGIPPRLAHAVGGVLETMRDMQAVFAPHMNSARRFGPGAFAPSAPEWGIDHRGTAIRIPEAQGKGARLEHRICGTDVNPHLAFAAILGGVLRGLEQGTDPGPPLALGAEAGRRVAPLSPDWAANLERFAASDFVAEIFGTRYRTIYAEVRRDEIARLAPVITEAEYRTYLSRL